MNRPETRVARRPCRLAFSFPPTTGELEALFELRKKRSVTGLFASTIEDGRICLLVEWSGSEAVPEALSSRRAAFPLSVHRRPEAES